MKIQPIDCTTPECFESVKTVPKSRLRRLFDFSSFLRGSAVVDRSVAGEFEPSSVCLDRLVQNFIEESNEKQSVTGGTKISRHNYHQCNCVNGKCCCSTDCSDDEVDLFNCFGNPINACDSLKSLVLCESVLERNLLADTAKIVDKNKICKKKDEISRQIVADGLLAAGYTVSICKSRWEKTSTYPAGEYEYIDAMVEGVRLIIDIDFRSEFEIARSTKTYRSVLQILPHIFVGRPDRLKNIINIVSDAAKQSLKKKGMPLPPWRRADYVKAKWFSPRNNQSSNDTATKSNTISVDEPEFVTAAEEERSEEAVKQQWEPPLKIKPKASKTGGKVISGLASVIEGK